MNEEQIKEAIEIVEFEDEEYCEEEDIDNLYDDNNELSMFDDEEITEEEDYEIHPECFDPENLDNYLFGE